MIQSNQVYAIRRQVLGVDQNYIAEKAGVTVDDVISFEHGIRIPFAAYDAIKTAIRNEFCELSPLEHYQKRILEISMKLQIEDDQTKILQEIAHMQIELAKLQNEIIGVNLRTKEDWT
jgi:hypothetical protein